MESSVEGLVALLDKWSKAETRVHLSLENNWEGWKFDGVGSIDFVKLEEGVLKLVGGSWLVSFSVDRVERVAIVNPNETPEGVSFPESSGIEEVAYISDKTVLISLLQEDGEGNKTGGHSFLTIATVIDDKSIAKA